MDREAATVLLILLVLGILWYAERGPSIGGGPYLEPTFENQEKRQSFSKQEYKSFEPEKSAIQKFGQPQSSVIRTQTPIQTLTQIQPLQIASKDSLYKNKVYLSIANAMAEEPGREYLELFIPWNAEIDNIPITGWKLENSRNEEVFIGQGAYLVYSAEVNQERDIVLKKDEKAYLITGRSPIGTSFRTNICAGYFEQFQNFEPSLSKWSCPYPKDENKLYSANLSDVCLDYIERLPACQMPLPAARDPLSLDDGCVKYISENINYNACVEAHKFDENFYSTKTWMIYLGRDKEFWKQRRETITLYDADGKMIFQSKY